MEERYQDLSTTATAYNEACVRGIKVNDRSNNAISCREGTVFIIKGMTTWETRLEPRDGGRYSFARLHLGPSGPQHAFCALRWCGPRWSCQATLELPRHPEEPLTFFRNDSVPSSVMAHPANPLVESCPWAVYKFEDEMEVYVPLPSRKEVTSEIHGIHVLARSVVYEMARRADEYARCI